MITQHKKMLHPSKYFEQVYLGRKRERKKTCFDWIGVGEEEQRVSLFNSNPVIWEYLFFPFIKRDHNGAAG